MMFFTNKELTSFFVVSSPMSKLSVFSMIVRMVLVVATAQKRHPRKLLFGLLYFTSISLHSSITPLVKYLPQRLKHYPLLSTLSSQSIPFANGGSISWNVGLPLVMTIITLSSSLITSPMSRLCLHSTNRLRR